jgi:hypothetical protein
LRALTASLLALIFHPEDGGCTLLRNIWELISQKTASNPAILVCDVV